MQSCLVLIDGQHYPPVIERALQTLSGQGYRVVGAVFLGGTEKTDRPPVLGVPVGVGPLIETLAEFIKRYDPEVVIDLSDEPVLDHRLRFELISVALQAGVAYRGAGYRFDPPPMPRLTATPSVAVTGTGKRTGKTSVAIELARYWRSAGRRVAIVTMGRGGPPEPVVLRAGTFPSSLDGLLTLAGRGLHAASDYVEDAVFANVDTIGTFRCGAGVSGETDIHNFAGGVIEADRLGPELMIFEGSGTAIPPASTDAHVLVMPVDIDPGYVTGYLGPYRVRTASSAVVVDTAPDGGTGFEILRTALHGLNPDLDVVRATYEMEPSVSVEGCRVLAVTTAPEWAGEHLIGDLKRQGATGVELIHSLSDRDRLRTELAGAGPADVLLVEVKAAAVDVVLPWAAQMAMTAGLIHNRVLVEGGTKCLADPIERRLA